MSPLEAFTKRDTAKGRWAQKVIQGRPTETEVPRVEKIFLTRTALSYADAEYIAAIAARAG